MFLRLTKLSGSKRSYEDKWIFVEIYRTALSIASVVTMNGIWNGCETHTFNCTLKNKKSQELTSEFSEYALLSSLYQFAYSIY